MDSRTLFISLACNHNLARGLALALLETAQAAAPAADDFYGHVNVRTNAFGSVDVWLDCAGAETWQTVHAAVNDGHVVFRNVDTDGVPTKLVGAIEGKDRLEFFVDDEDKLWLVIATAKLINA